MIIFEYIRALCAILFVGLGIYSFTDTLNDLEAFQMRLIAFVCALLCFAAHEVVRLITNYRNGDYN